MDWNSAKLEASQLVENREHYQRRLGELSAGIVEEFGLSKLDEFAMEVKEDFGLGLSASTLRNYLWVYNKTKDLDLPEDLSYRTLQWISASGEPEMWAQRIKDEGLSSAEVYRLMRKAKGIKENEVVCPACQNRFIIKK